MFQLLDILSLLNTPKPQINVRHTQNIPYAIRIADCMGSNDNIFSRISVMTSKTLVVEL